MKEYVSASILGADFSRLAEEIKKAERFKVDMIHFDVMDGQFVPNISFGIPVLKSIRKCTEIPFDVHLMIKDPIKYIEDFAKAGADIITFHAESNSNIEETINLIHSYGLKAGISIKPATPVEVIIPYIDKIEMALILTVEPGFGGQDFIDQTLPKIAKLREIITDIHLNVDIQVDGGINDKTIAKVRSHGANNFVSGSYIFGADDMRSAVASLKA